LSSASSPARPVASGSTSALRERSKPAPASSAAPSARRRHSGCSNPLAAQAHTR